MEILREFLESSTIHGLYYISKAKVIGLSYGFLKAQCFRQDLEKHFGALQSFVVSLELATLSVTRTWDGRSPP